MLNFEEQVKLGISLMQWNIDIKDLKTIDLYSKGIPATYIYEPTKGGKSIIVSNTGDVLVGNSTQSFEQLLNEFNNGKKTEFNKEQSIIQEVKCSNCGNITEFDTTKVPTNIKFDYKCSNCGAFHMIKLTDPLENKIQYFKQYIFTIKDLKDPFWENACQKIGTQIVEKLAKQGKSVHYILSHLNTLYNMYNLEEYFISEQIELPESDKTKDFILETFKGKLLNVKKILDLKPQGLKW